MTIIEVYCLWVKDEFMKGGQKTQTKEEIKRQKKKMQGNNEYIKKSTQKHNLCNWLPL